MDFEFLCRNYDCTFCFDMVCIKSKLCDNRIKPTNADRIRAMSDEELADFLYETEVQYIPIDLSVENNWLDWLKQEVE